MKKVIKMVIKPENLESPYEHSYAILSQNNTTIKAEHINFCCFGKLKSSGIRMATLTARNILNCTDVLYNYFGKANNKKICIERKKLYAKILKEFPTLYPFVGKPYNVNGVSCIDINLNLAGATLAKGLFLFRGLNRMDEGHLSRIYNWSIEDKVIYLFLLQNGDPGSFPYSDAMPWVRYTPKDGVIKFLKTSHRAKPFIETLNFQLLDTASRYRKRRVNSILLDEHWEVGY